MVVLAFNTVLGALTVAAPADMTVAFRLTSAAIVCLIFIPLLLIYWSAGWIVDFMTPKAEEALPETKIGIDDVQAIAFSAVGAFILFIAVRETIGLLSILPRLSVADEAYIVQNALRAAAAWVVGLYLLIGAPQVRRWIGSMRRAGRSVE
jgi:hypothetical protein